METAFSISLFCAISSGILTTSGAANTKKAIERIAIRTTSSRHSHLCATTTEMEHRLSLKKSVKLLRFFPAHAGKSRYQHVLTVRPTKIKILKHLGVFLS
jgi:hypothetical protein